MSLREFRFISLERNNVKSPIFASFDGFTFEEINYNDLEISQKTKNDVFLYQSLCLKNDEFEKEEKDDLFSKIEKIQLKLAIDIQKELQNKLICFGTFKSMSGYKRVLINSFTSFENLLLEEQILTKEYLNLQKELSKQQDDLMNKHLNSIHLERFVLAVYCNNCNLLSYITKNGDFNHCICSSNKVKKISGDVNGSISKITGNNHEIVSSFKIINKQIKKENINIFNLTNQISNIIQKLSKIRIKINNFNII